MNPAPQVGKFYDYGNGPSEFLGMGWYKHYDKVFIFRFNTKISGYDLVTKDDWYSVDFKVKEL